MALLASSVACHSIATLLHYIFNNLFALLCNQERKNDTNKVTQTNVLCSSLLAWKCLFSEKSDAIWKYEFITAQFFTRDVCLGNICTELNCCAINYSFNESKRVEKQTGKKVEKQTGKKRIFAVCFRNRAADSERLQPAASSRSLPRTALSPSRIPHASAPRRNPRDCRAVTSHRKKNVNKPVGACTLPPTTATEFSSLLLSLSRLIKGTGKCCRAKHDI